MSIEWNYLYGAASELIVAKKLGIQLLSVSFNEDGRVRVSAKSQSTSRENYVKFLIAGVVANKVILKESDLTVTELFKDRIRMAETIAGIIPGDKSIKRWENLTADLITVEELEEKVEMLREMIYNLTGYRYTLLGFGRSIDTLGLSRGTRNALIRAGYNFVEDLPKDIENLNARCIGDTRKAELKEKLQSLK